MCLLYFIGVILFKKVKSGVFGKKILKMGGGGDHIWELFVEEEFRRSAHADKINKKFVHWVIKK